MKTVDERIENLSDELLDVFVSHVSGINCGPLICSDCPLQTDGGCMCVKFYEEKDKRKLNVRTKHESAKTPVTSTIELEARAHELVEQLDHLVELLSKF